MTENITFDDGFHQTNFLDSLQYIPHVLSDIPFPSSLITYYSDHNLNPLQLSFLPQTIGEEFQSQEAPQFTAQEFNGYLASFTLPQIPGPTGPTQAFTNYSDFAAGFYTYMINALDGGGVYQGLLQDFAAAMNIQLDSNNNMVGGDWQILTNSPPASPSISFTDSTSATNPFIMAFNKFLSQYQYPSAGLTYQIGVEAPPYLDSFLKQWHQYLSGIAAIQTANSSYGSANLASYQAIYSYFARDPSDAAFKARLNQFYEDEVNANGYFLPSHMFANWVTAIRNENGLNVNAALIGSSLAGNDSEKALILNRIILLLISIIQTLQNAGIAQANRLTYTTQYQNAYTALQTQVPVFLGDGSSPIGKTGSNSTEAGSARNDLNSSFNGILIDNLRSLRGIQEDTAKKLQSNVNTTNDAVNQQTDMATTFLQQLSTLLSSILR